MEELNFWTTTEFVNVTSLSPTNQNQKGVTISLVCNGGGDTDPGGCCQPSYL